jgi:hypothetical protein
MGIAGSTGQLVKEAVQRETGRLAGSKLGASEGQRVNLFETLALEWHEDGIS